MRTHMMMAWGLAASMALGIAVPGKADKPTVNPGRDEMRVRITVTEVDDKDDMRAFQAWYGRQVHDYDRIDTETGERLADLLQMVVEVSDDKLLVTDDSNLRRGVIVTRRTRITLQDDDRRGYAATPMRKPTTTDYRRPQRLTDQFRPGDLIIAEGYLRAKGGITATNIRVMGRARDYRDDGYRVDRYGYRAWGEVRSVDTRRDRIEIDTDKGRTTITLGRDATILSGGKEVSLGFLHRGDRVIFYSRDTDRGGTITAYRVVVLDTKDRYPDGDHPCHADPDYRDDRDHGTTGPMLEGRLQSITTGVFFNKMVITGQNGLSYTIRFSKTIQVADRDGDLISPLNLRTNERLRIHYADVAGNLFAERIEIQ